jgi:cytoskeletal protein RodZ
MGLRDELIAAALAPLQQQLREQAQQLAQVPSQVQLAHDNAVSTAATDATTKDKQVVQQAATDASTKAGTAKSDAVQVAQQAANTAQQAAAMAAATPSRLRAKRIPLPSLAGGLAGSVQVAWDTPFPSINYTLAGCEVVGTSLLRITGVTAFTKEGCTVNFLNTSVASLLGASVATLHISAFHDPLT